MVDIKAVLGALAQCEDRLGLTEPERLTRAVGTDILWRTLCDDCAGRGGTIGHPCATCATLGYVYLRTTESR
jgi:DnaJ-class molecular chaperone